MSEASRLPRKRAHFAPSPRLRRGKDHLPSPTEIKSILRKREKQQISSGGSTCRDGQNEGQDQDSNNVDEQDVDLTVEVRLSRQKEHLRKLDSFLKHLPEPRRLNCPPLDDGNTRESLSSLCRQLDSSFLVENLENEANRIKKGMQEKPWLDSLESNTRNNSYHTGAEDSQIETDSDDESEFSETFVDDAANGLINRTSTENTGNRPFLAGSSTEYSDGARSGWTDGCSSYEELRDDGSSERKGSGHKIGRTVGGPEGQPWTTVPPKPQEEDGSASVYDLALPNRSSAAEKAEKTQWQDGTTTVLSAIESLARMVHNTLAVTIGSQQSTAKEPTDESDRYQSRSEENSRPAPAPRSEENCRVAPAAKRVSHSRRFRAYQDEKNNTELPSLQLPILGASVSDRTGQAAEKPREPGSQRTARGGQSATANERKIGDVSRVNLSEREKDVESSFRPTGKEDCREHATFVPTDVHDLLRRRVSVDPFQSSSLLRKAAVRQTELKSSQRLKCGSGTVETSSRSHGTAEPCRFPARFLHSQVPSIDVESYQALKAKNDRRKTFALSVAESDDDEVSESEEKPDIVDHIVESENEGLTDFANNTMDDNTQRPVSAELLQSFQEYRESLILSRQGLMGRRVQEIVSKKANGRWSALVKISTRLDSLYEDLEQKKSAKFSDQRADLAKRLGSQQKGFNRTIAYKSSSDSETTNRKQGVTVDSYQIQISLLENLVRQYTMKKAFYCLLWTNDRLRACEWKVDELRSAWTCPLKCLVLLCLQKAVQRRKRLLLLCESTFQERQNAYLTDVIAIWRWAAAQSKTWRDALEDFQLRRSIGRARAVFTAWSTISQDMHWHKVALSSAKHFRVLSLQRRVFARLQQEAFPQYANAPCESMSRALASICKVAIARHPSARSGIACESESDDESAQNETELNRSSSDIDTYGRKFHEDSTRLSGIKERNSPVEREDVSETELAEGILSGSASFQRRPRRDIWAYTANRNSSTSLLESREQLAANARPDFITEGHRANLVLSQTKEAWTEAPLARSTAVGSPPSLVHAASSPFRFKEEASTSTDAVVTTNARLQTSPSLMQELVKSTAGATADVGVGRTPSPIGKERDSQEEGSQGRSERSATVAQQANEREDIDEGNTLVRPWLTPEKSAKLVRFLDEELRKTDRQRERHNKSQFSPRTPPPVAVRINFDTPASRASVMQEVRRTPFSGDRARRIEAAVKRLEMEGFSSEASFLLSQLPAAHRQANRADSDGPTTHPPGRTLAAAVRYYYRLWVRRARTLATYRIGFRAWRKFTVLAASAREDMATEFLDRKAPLALRGSFEAWKSIVMESKQDQLNERLAREKNESRIKQKYFHEWRQYGERRADVRFLVEKAIRRYMVSVVRGSCLSFTLCINLPSDLARRLLGEETAMRFIRIRSRERARVKLRCIRVS